MQSIHIKTQDTLNAVPAGYNGRIFVEFGTPKRPAVIDRTFVYPVRVGSNYTAVVKARAFVSAHDSAKIFAEDNTIVDAADKAVVTAKGASRIYARGKTKVYVSEHASANLFDKAKAVASGNAFVAAYGQTEVVVCEDASAAGTNDVKILKHPGEASLATLDVAVS